MKKTILLLFFFIQFSSFGQVAQDSQLVNAPFIIYKNGMRYAVSKPVVICDSMCYYINRFNKKVYAEPISKIEGFSNKNDVRWMTYDKLQQIGSTSVKGYFWGIITIYPTGLGIFIMSDITKRRNIKKITQNIIKKYENTKIN
jgi:hypothetical protein